MDQYLKEDVYPKFGIFSADVITIIENEMKSQSESQSLVQSQSQSQSQSQFSLVQPPQPQSLLHHHEEKIKQEPLHPVDDTQMNDVV